MFCSTRSRFHLCAKNRPWKENYIRSQGRKEGVAHTLQPNILIYKELIKYFKSKMASQFSHWWLVWEISVSLLPNFIFLLFFSSHWCHLESIVLLHFISVYAFITSKSPFQLLYPLRFFFFLLPSLFNFAFMSFSAPPASVSLEVLNQYLLTLFYRKASSEQFTHTHNAEYLYSNWLAILT